MATTARRVTLSWPQRQPPVQQHWVDDGTTATCLLDFGERVSYSSADFEQTLLSLLQAKLSKRPNVEITYDLQTCPCCGAAVAPEVVH